MTGIGVVFDPPLLWTIRSATILRIEWRRNGIGCIRGIVPAGRRFSMPPNPGSIAHSRVSSQRLPITAIGPLSCRPSIPAGCPMQVHFLFVIRKLLAWLFALLSALLPHHLLLQVPENERCLAPHEAALAEVPPPVQAPTGPMEEAVTTARRPQR